jgi:type IV secretion system protein VirB10
VKPEETTTEDTVRGERGRPFVASTRSLQSRVSSIMACGLMIILGAGMLTWYYTNAMSRQSRSKRNAQAAAFHRVQGEMPLPALDGFSSLKTAPAETRHEVAGSQQVADGQQFAQGQQAADGRPPALAQTLTAEPPQLPLMPSQSRWEPTTGPHRTSYGHGMRKSAEALAQERLLAGAAFARESGSRAAIANPAATFADRMEQPLDLGGAKAADASWSEGTIAPLLRPSTIASARAKVLPTRRFLLGKGAFIDCTLETAIDSTLPGMTTCITATDTFSADGTVVLLERGTKLIGETRGQVQQGVARVFVLWTEARTPTGIVVPLDSPGADELGRSGLPGSVNRHFWDRFGAAILISTLDGAVQAAVQSASRGGGPIIYNPSSSESVLTDVLKNSVNIPPTVTKANGDRIQVFVARDVDFRSVYELRSVTTEQ